MERVGFWSEGCRYDVEFLILVFLLAFVLVCGFESE